ncbi:MAG: pitrilysin family protein, partial [Thermostichales cyanobacterium HHBFW_bins_127]
NGMTVIVKSMPVTEVVAVDVWIKTGSRHDPAWGWGMSHFLEHMVFKGTPTLPPGAFDRLIEGRGGMTNAATSYDYTHYYVTVAAADVAEVLPALAELILGAGIPAAELERERLVVLEELRGAADDPDHEAYQRLMAQVFAGHPYGRSVLGTMESVAGITAEQMRAFHRRRYRPSQMVVAVAGAVDGDQLLLWLEQCFGQWPDPGDPEGEEEPGVVATAGGRLAWEHPRVELPRLYMVWPTVALPRWSESICLDLLAVVLGQGRISRLVRRLREDYGWVRGIGCHHQTQVLGGYFLVAAHLHSGSPERVEQVIRQELAAVQQEGITPAELTRAQKALSHELLFSSESAAQVAGLLGYYALMGELPSLAASWEWLQQVRLESLRLVAEHYLPLDGYTLLHLSPTRVPLPQS